MPVRLTVSDRRALAKIFALPFSRAPLSLSGLAILTEEDEAELSQRIKRLVGEGLVTLQPGSGGDGGVPAALTKKGRESLTVVFAGGSFDIIHPGHIETLEASKALGDVLIVSVARDSTFERNKKRKPFFSEEVRRRSVSALRCVDAAALGSETDIFEIVERVRPDVIALGYDQHHQESFVSEECRRRGIDVRVVRLGRSIPDVKTSKLVGEDPRLIMDS